MVNRGKMNDLTLIFLHIPKTAGSTLTSALCQKYGDRAVFRVFSAGQAEKEKYIDSLYKNMDHVKVIAGHMFFGWHQSLPDPAKSTYITLLRDPVERVISDYYYIIRRPEHYLHDTLKYLNIDFESFVSNRLSVEIDNFQTRLLAGQINDRYSGPPDLDRAIRNVNAFFSLVGLTERFDESLVLLKNELNWKSYPFYIKRNVTEKRPKAEDVPGYIVEMIKKRNELDCMLYAHMEDLFNQRFNRQRPLIDYQVKKFIRMNRIYGRLLRLKEKMNWVKQKKRFRKRVKSVFQSELI